MATGCQMQGSCRMQLLLLRQDAALGILSDSALSAERECGAVPSAECESVSS